MTFIIASMSLNNTAKSLNYEKHDYYFINNNKSHYIAVAKPKALSAGFLSNHDWDRFF